MTARLFSAAVARAVRRPWLTLGIAAALGIAAVALASGLSPSAATSTFVSGSSPQYRATQRYYANFGEEPVDVVVLGNLQQLLLSSDIERLVGLEGCLSGNVPVKALGSEGGLNGPCGQLARLHTVKVVLGPGTFVNEAAEQIDQQLSAQSSQAEAQAREAQRLVTRAALARGRSAAQAAELGRQAHSITIARFQEGIAALALQYGLTSKPGLENPNFVSTLVFDSAKPAGTPKQRFAYLFPSPNAALISVRMRADLSEAARDRTIASIERAVAMPQWRLAHGESYEITGEPAIVSELTSSISHSIELLAAVALLAMAIVLGLLFRGRPRLLPLLSALLACALTFGALALVAPALSVAQVAVLPVLIGLAVDYAIQLQSRAGELLAAGGVRDRRAAVTDAAGLAGPTIGVAVLAGVAATLVLLTSPVPMVGGFAVLLAVGIAIAFACALTAGSAALVLAGGAGAGFDAAAGVGTGEGPAEVGAAGEGVQKTVGAVGESAQKTVGAVGEGAQKTLNARARVRARMSSVQAHDICRELSQRLAPAWRGARELLIDNPIVRGVSRLALGTAVRRPGRVLAVGLVLAVLGWGLGTQTPVQTDLTKLVPQNTAALHNLNTLERLSGVGGEIDLMVGGANVTAPKTIEWMSAYESAMLRRFGYTSTRGCGHAKLCPAFSLPDLFGGEGVSAASGAGADSSTDATPATGATSASGASAPKTKLTSAQVRALLHAIPPYFSQEVIAPDHRVATLAFGIKLMGLDEQQRVIEAMRAALHPPRGVSAQLVGLPVLAAQAGAQVASPWRRIEMLLLGLVAVALVLSIAFRAQARRVLAPLIPVVLASGWSALVLFAVRVPLNPMSVTLGVLVIAIATEFSVLLAERYRQERAAGHDAVQALALTYRHTGAAVAASGATAIAGFGVLVVSDIAMLRDFGLVTLIDLSVTLVGVLVALPAAVMLSERGVRLVVADATAPLARRLMRGRAGHEPV